MVALLKLFFFCFFCPCVVIYIYHLVTKKYLNPYKLYMIFGKKGSGKTTLLTKIALTSLAKGKFVYSTEAIPGCYKIEPSDIGYVMFPRDSVVLIDEVGLVWDSRDFKKFDKNVNAWFKYQRHLGVTVYLFSQTFDVDKKIRDLVDAMYLVQNKFRVFSYAKKISKLIVLTESTSEGESRIAENLTFEPFIFFMFGSRKLTFIPKWSMYFDSFVNDLTLEERSFPLIPAPTPISPNEKHTKHRTYKNYPKFVGIFKKNHRKRRKRKKRPETAASSIE